jgi:hypothetical protein
MRLASKQREEVDVMTTIKATCPRCGDVDLVPADVRVTVARELGWSTYTFTCGGCAEAICKTADEDVVQLLTGAGVRVDHLAIPLEYLESRVIERTCTPLTRDDLLDFALWLASVDDIVMAADQEV